jgi:hypothetical protein
MLPSTNKPALTNTPPFHAGRRRARDLRTPLFERH